MSRSDAIDVAELFTEHHADLFRYLSRLTGDPELAADAVQEAFVRLAERPPEPRELRGWLFRVATNAAREWARTRARRLRLLATSPARAPVGEAPAAPDVEFEARERRQRVRDALARLSERDRTILLMREEGFTHREIAKTLGTTTGSVGTLIARAMNKLAAEIGLAEEEP